MSIQILLSDATFSSSDGAWRHVGSAVGWGIQDNSSSTYNIGLSVTRYIYPTFDYDANQVGIGLIFRGGGLTYGTLNITLQQSKGTCTMTIASPGVVTNAGHGFTGNEPIVFATTGALPTGLVAGTVYYVKYIDANTFNVSATPGGANINTSGSQSGTHTLWAVRTTDNFDITTNKVVGGATYSSIEPQYLGLTSYAVTAGGTWRYSLYNAGGIVVQGTLSTDLHYMAVTDYSTTKPATGDAAVIASNVVLTLDADLSLNSVTGKCYSLNLFANATFQWQNPPAASYTLTLANIGSLSPSSKIYIGSEASPIPVAQKALLVCPSGLFSTWLSRQTGSDINPTLYAKMVIEMVGEEYSYLGAEIASYVPSSQSYVDTTVDMSAIWTVGDAITFIGHLGNSNYKVTRTITSFAGTRINLNTTVGGNIIAGGEVINTTKASQLGIEIQGTLGAATLFISNTSAYVGYDYYKFMGIHFSKDTALNVCGAVSGGTGSEILNGNQCKIRNLFFIETANIYPKVIAYAYSGMVVDGIYIHRSANEYTNAGGVYLAGNNMTVSNVYVRNVTRTQGGITIVGNNVVGTRLISAPGQNAGAIYFGIGLYGAGCTYTDLIATATNPFYINLTSSTIRDLVADNGYVENVYFAGTCVGLRLVDPILGPYTAALTAEFAFASGAYVQIVVDNGNLPGSPVAIISNVENTVNGSYIRFVDYDMVANDDRGYETYGEFQRVGDGLVDTTAHTNGTGKFGFRIKPTSSAVVANWVFDIPTGNIQAMTMTVAVWVKINNAAYYAGTHQKPRLEVDYDNGTVSYAEAVAGTGWQLLSVTFVPATTYGQVTVTVSGRTDAVGSNAYFYVDDFAVLYPAGYKLDLGGLDLWANALPVVPPIATVLSANDVWGALDTISYGANTMGDRMRTILSTFDPDVDLVEGTITVTQALRVLLALLAGDATGGGTPDVRFRDQADTKDRVRMLVDGNGNRLSVMLDLS